MDSFDNENQSNSYNESEENKKWEDVELLEEIPVDDVRDFALIEAKEISISRKKRIKNSIIIIVIAALISSILTLTITYAFLPNLVNARKVSLGASQQPITIKPTQDMTVYSAVAKKVMPSVVGITTMELTENWFFGVTKSSGVGTGVIVDERGYILTNSHVIGDGNAQEVTVLFHDGTQKPAEVLWFEKSLDLAIIKVDIEGNNLPVADLGDSDQLEVGEIAMAIGNPLGLNFERTLTQGIVSGLNRTITLDNGETIENLIQTDASINPGNSGGPLLNAKGEVIGINTVKVKSGEGLGFAIPINIAKPVVDQFIKNGEFQRVYLGISGIEVDVFKAITKTQLQAEYGVYVAEVLPDSVAEKHDIRPGDVIIKVGDEEVRKMSSLIKTLYHYTPGDSTTLTVLRNGQEIKINITFNK